MAGKNIALNDISLNSPCKIVSSLEGDTSDCVKLKNAEILNTRMDGENMVYDSFWGFECSRIAPNSDIIRKRVRDFLQRPCIEDVQEVSLGFKRLYRTYLWKHQFNLVKELVKQNMLAIIKIVELQSYDAAVQEVLNIYNETNHHKAESLEQFLLADFTTSNDYYLSALKLLALQIIIKGKRQDFYGETILKLFANDSRYILRTEKIKIQPLTKILLNFFSLLPDFKALFSLKFMQYVKQFDLNFESYIKNMDMPKFQEMIPIWTQRSSTKTNGFLGLFYSSYSQYFQSVDKIMLHDLVNPSSRDRIKVISKGFNSLSSHEWSQGIETFTNLSIIERNSLLEFIESQLEEKKFDSQKVAILLRWFLQLANNELSPATRQLWRIVDRITVFINSNLHSLSIHIVKELLDIIYDLCIVNLEPKRLLNIANVAFNSFIVFKNDIFVLQAAKFDLARQTIFKQEGLDLTRLEKFLSSASSGHRIKLFTDAFNVFTCFEYESLGSLTEVTSRFAKCLRSVNIRASTELSGASELMICLLSTLRPLEPDSISCWSPLTRMLYHSLTNYAKDNNKTEKCRDTLDPLKDYEVLIKTIYSLGLEIKKSSSHCLAKVSDNFTENWVKRLNFRESTMISLENSAIRTLFGYLRFNKFHKKVIDLALALKNSPHPYYEHCAENAQEQLIRGYVGLQMKTRILEGCSELMRLAQNPRLENLKRDQIFMYAETQLEICFWKRDFDTFNKIFVEGLPITNPEVMNVTNTLKLPTKLYLKCLVLSINIVGIASNLQIHAGNLIEALVEAKRSIKLCQTLLKKVTQLDQEIKWKVLTSLGTAFANIINIYTQLGVSRDCDFYVTEYLRVSCSMKDPVVIHECLQKCVGYYRLTDQLSLADALLRKANGIFNQLDGSENFDDLALFLLNNGEHEKLANSLRLFFKDYFSESLLVDIWSLALGGTHNRYHEDATLRRLSGINEGKQLYEKISKQMDTDAFFGSVKESVTTIPSCVLPALEVRKHPATSVCEFGTPTKNKGIPFTNLNSPRPSSLTPRGKSLKQKFDRAKALNDLETVKRLVGSLSTDGMKNYEIVEASDLYSLVLSLLSSITTSRLSSSAIEQMLTLAELPKMRPLHFDKILSSQGNEIYGSFIPLQVDCKRLSIDNQLQDIVRNQTDMSFNSDPHLFNVVCIDVCGITGDLILTRTDSGRNKVMCLRLPLSRGSSRDVDEVALSFHDAMEELKSIIKESNITTSSDVTAAINTKDDRKQWWQRRYDLDARLRNLILKIENSWFSGFKTFFKQETIEQRHLDHFRVKLEEILQESLPTRKQFGNPANFFRIDDVVLDLFLKLDPLDSDFMEMMEDLIFFVFDLLLFHGEENAYDEIDVNMIHIQIEEFIKEFRTTVPPPPKLAHTFLVVCSAGHLMPWESLGFLAKNSISRIPSTQILFDLIEKEQHLISPLVELEQNISVILNPDGDLVRTQADFMGPFEEWCSHAPGSRLIVGEKPDEKTFLEMLTKAKTFIYVGHGGGEQFVRLKKIKQQNCIAPSFLLGCSSAYMQNFGKLEPSGIAYSYLLGGSSMVVGNLWDVTDKDIDKFSRTMFEKLGLVGEEEETYTVSDAVASARYSCQLKYLNGAAPVVYGLPLRFTRSKQTSLH